MPAFPDLQSAFAAGLATGALPPGVTAQSPTEADRRFAVYRNNVATSLSRALASRFPVIERLVGAAFFTALARVYSETHRPTSPVLLEWGDSFPAFLASFPPLAQYPYMADVARIELARGKAYHAADCPPVAPDVLARTAQDAANATLRLHPSVTLIRSTHPAVSIWDGNQPGRTNVSLAGKGAEIALVLRDRALDVQVMAINPGDAALIDALQDRETLLSAATAAAQAMHGHDPSPLLVLLMQAGAIIDPECSL